MRFLKRRKYVRYYRKAVSVFWTAEYAMRDFEWHGMSHSHVIVRHHREAMARANRFGKRLIEAWTGKPWRGK